MPSKALVAIAASLAAMSAVPAALAQVTRLHGEVLASADVYGVKGKLPEGATRPFSFTLPAGAACVTAARIRGSFKAPQCSSPEGCITVNQGNGTNYNDPDGAMAQVGESSNTGASSISGIKAPGAGYLVGVFTQGPPTGMAPPRLDFTHGLKTKFAALSPLLDQAYFIGDGRRKDDIAKRQLISVPAGATTLYIGISDTCENYNGSPGCYFDNIGFYKVAFDVSTAVCPAP